MREGCINEMQRKGARSERWMLAALQLSGASSQQVEMMKEWGAPGTAAGAPAGARGAPARTSRSGNIAATAERWRLARVESGESVVRGQRGA